MKFFRKLTSIPEKKEALLALTASSILWGLSAPIMKLLLAVTPLFLLAFLRFFIASIIFLLFRPNLRLERKDIPRIAFAAIINISIHIPLFFYGLSLTSVINATMIAAAGPLFTLFLAKEFLKEDVKKNMLIGGFIGLGGFAIVFLNPLITNGFSISLLGNALLFLSTLSWIYYEILLKKMHKKYDAKTLTFYTFFIGSIPLLPFALPSFHLIPELLKLPVFLFGIIWGILITSLLAFFLWQWGLARLSLSRVGFFSYVDPIVATVAAIIILEETLTYHFVVGALLIFIGLYVAEATIHYPHFHLYHAHMRKRSG